MTQAVWMRRIAGAVRRFPWAAVLARRAWGLVSPKVSLGVVGVVFDDRGRVLMAEHVFHPYRPWGLPGGWVSRGEDPAETVRREFLEELELAVDVGPVVAIENDGGHVNIAFVCFARGDIGALSFELLGCDWYGPDDLPGTHPFHRQAIRAARAHLESMIQV